MTKVKNSPVTPGSTPSEDLFIFQEDGLSVPKWMISSVPELPTEQEVKDRQAWIAALYSDSVFDDIAKVARFTSYKDKADMREFLLKAGYMYIEQKDDRPIAASFAPDRNQLERIARLADKLESALANLSDVSAQSFWHPFEQVRIDPWGPSYTTPYGLTVIRRPQSDGSFIIEHLRPPQIEEAVHVIRRLAELAAASLPDQKGGQPQFGARQSWLFSAQHFWRDHTTSAFDPRSHALDFCYKALKLLDDSIEPRQIDSAMRAANKAFPDPKRKRPKPAQEPG